MKTVNYFCKKARSHVCQGSEYVFDFNGHYQLLKKSEYFNSLESPPYVLRKTSRKAKSKPNKKIVNLLYFVHNQNRS